MPSQNPSSPGAFRVLLYSRVSSPRQASHGHSLEAQPEELTNWTEALGWSVVGQISDAGRSGRTADRKGFAALMDLIRELRPDAVVVTRLSRFMRNARLTLNAVHELREMGVALICKDEPIDTRQRGVADLVLAILSTMAEWESERLSEYSKETRQRFIAQGRWPAGKPPYGCRLDKPTGELVIVEDEAEVVRLIYDLYTRSGIGIGAIVKELSARAIPSPTGKSIWGISVVSAVLKNSVYAGQHKLGMTAPPIVSQSIFERAQSLRSTNKTIHPPRVDPWPLQNRLRCGWCGGRFRCFYSRTRLRRYRCQGREGGSTHFLLTGEKCPSLGLLAEDIESQILHELLQCLSSPRNFRAALEVSISELRVRLADLERDVEPVRRELDQVREELSRLARDWVRNALTEGEVEQLQKSALERRERLEARVEALGPGRVAELERTRANLAAVEEELTGAESAPQWWRDYQVWNQILPSEVVEVYDSPDPLYDDLGDLPQEEFMVLAPGETLAWLLARLQAEVWFGPEGLAIKGLIEMPVTEDQGSCSATKT
ncbi:MAG: recombinase family protein [Dehalococcoidia bacterium]